MLGSHALHISRRGTSEVDEQSVPLASSVAGNSTKPTASFGNKKEKQSRRGSLVDTAFARAVPEAVQLRAIAEVTENPRRASIAIRRQSLIQSLQSEAADDQHGDPYRPPGRGSISALIPGPPPATSRISAYPRNVYSLAEQGHRTSSIQRDGLGRRNSALDRRGSPAQPSAIGRRRRSSVVDAVAAKTTQAVRRASLAILGEKVSHYASLVLAEKPLEAHQQYKRRRSSIAIAQFPPDIELGPQGFEEQIDMAMPQPQAMYLPEDDVVWEQNRQMNVRRWQAAAATLINSAAMVKDINTLSERYNKPAARFAAAVDLAMKLEGHPQKDAILEALERRRLGRVDAFFENFLTELAVTGERMFELFTPAKLGQHRLFFTCGWTFVVFSVFWYMIGAFSYYEAVQFPDPQRSACLRTSSATPASYGSSQLVHWINQAAPWCYGGDAWLLGGDFLIVWGARWGPLMRAQPYRWFTSWFLHQSFTHVLSNVLLFLVIAIQMEEKYGCLRMVVLWLFSSLGGNFFSAAFEDTCLALVGASGGVFGMVGLFIADMVVNFASIRRPILRSIMMLAFLIYFIITVATTPVGTSHLSHVGGFMTGLFPGMMFLPHLKSQKFEAWIPMLGAVVTVIVFVALPTYFYTHKYPYLDGCGADITRYY